MFLLPTLTFADATTTDATSTSATTTPLVVATSTSSATSTDISTASTTTPQAATSTSATTTLATELVTLSLRIGNAVVGPYTIPLPASTTPYSLTPTNGSTSIAIPARSVLARLTTQDSNTSDFDVTNVKYYSSFNSFYLKCILVPTASSSPFCDNWQYVVNGIAPSVGMDVYSLNDHDSVYVYFGSPRSVAVTATTTTVGTAFTATAQTYNPVTNSFSPITGVTLGATQPDPTNPYSPLEIATSTVNSSGQVIFTLNATGTYDIGIQDDYYYPTTRVIIVAAPVATTSPVSGGGGGPIGIAHTPLDVTRALNYLLSQEHSDGSFSSGLYTDWASLALAATNASTLSTLKSFETTHTQTFSTITDYERHAMALEALGINPYSGSPVDVITPIIKAFDGTQIGDTNLITDDIFAIFPLTHAGYSSKDDIIKKEVAFILSKQLPNGSWENSIDITAAAMQALGPLFDIKGVNSHLGASIAYITGQEQSIGGWNNVDSTSWMQTTINTFNSFHVGQPSIWNSSFGYYPGDALGLAQQADGAVRPTTDPTDSRVWSTSYAIVGASGKDWRGILQQFARPTDSVSTGGGGGAITTTSSTSGATSTSNQISTSTATSSVVTSTSTTAIDASIGNSTSRIVGQVLGVSTTTAPTKPFRKSRVIKKKIHPIVVIDATTTPTSTTRETSDVTNAVDTKPNIGVWGRVSTWFANLF